MTRRATQRPTRHLAALVLILLVAAALRIAALGDVPPGLQHDEVFHAHDAFTVRQGYTPLWFSSNAGNEPLYIYLMAASTGLIGDQALGIRLTAVLCGMLTVALTYRWAGLVMGAAQTAAGRRGALVAAALIAAAFWPVWMSRVGLRAVSLPPMAALVGCAYTRANFTVLSRRDDRRALKTPGSIESSTGSGRAAALVRQAAGRIQRVVIGRFVLAGAALGLTLYTYPAAYAVVIVLVVYYGYLGVFRREVIRRAWQGHAAFWITAGLTYLPLGLALAGQEGGYLRVQQTATALQALQEGNAAPLLDGIVKTLGMWFVRGDPQWRYNVAGRPVFGPIWGILFVVGVAWLVGKAVKRGERHGEAAALAALFLILGGLPSAVTDLPPAFLRASAAMPAAFIAVGAGASLVGQKIPRQVFAPVVVGLIAATAGFTIGDYFGIWANNEEVQRVYRSDLAAIAEYLRTHDAPGGAAVSTSEPNHLDRFIFDYTPHGDGEIHWFDGLNALVVPAGGESAWVFVTREPEVREEIQADYLSRAEMVEERHFENGSLAYALYALPPGEAFFEAFPPPVGQGVWVSDAAAFPPDEEEGIRRRLDWPVQFGDVLELVGYESPQQNPAGTWLPIRLYFRVLRDVDAPEPWSLFAHVLGADGTLAAGRDFLAVPASTWRAGDVFIQLHDVALPGDLAAGVYHVEIGLYSQADMVRFPVMVDGEREGDRLLLQPVEVVQP